MKARINPFASHRVESLTYRYRAGNAATLLARAAELRWRGAIVGPQGSGKTTLLEQLARELVAAGKTVLSFRLHADGAPVPWPDLPAAREFTANHVVVLDGCEQLGFLAWWRWRYRCRRAGGLIISLHRPGRLPVLHRCATSPELLAELAAELLQEDAGDLRARAGELYRKHDGNIRLAMREWYDLVAGSSNFPHPMTPCRVS